MAKGVIGVSYVCRAVEFARSLHPCEAKLICGTRLGSFITGLVHLTSMNHDEPSKQAWESPTGQIS